MSIADGLVTESVLVGSSDLDRLSTTDIVSLMNHEDARIAHAVGLESDAIARVVDLAAASFRRGGRLVYVGAGTSGRLGVLDASECPPTFGTDPLMVVGVIAGGLPALTRAIEGAEDRREDGAFDIDQLGVDPRDVVIGIATSGRTPYVLGAVDRARRLGAATAGIACNSPSPLAGIVDVMIAPIVGPEVLAGSTRLKAGTATKMILNMISTGAMVQIGKAHGNLMVDLRPTNEKLRIRSRRILRDVAGIDDAEAARLLVLASGRLKTALVAALAGVEIQAADRLLAEGNGRVADAVARAKEVRHR